jgi:hypothetical protein
MSAQGILNNPMLFSGQDVIQKECIERFLKVFSCSTQLDSIL